MAAATSQSNVISRYLRRTCRHMYKYRTTQQNLPSKKPGTSIKHVPAQMDLPVAAATPSKSLPHNLALQLHCLMEELREYANW
jgi:hypothetical protein